MIALVTGGAGFIGSHLCESLLTQGWQVRIVDDLSRGRLKNIQHLLDQPGATFHQVDICQAQALDACLAPAADGAGVDWVFHLAGIADIVPSIEEPARYFQVNVQGTLNMLEACRHHGIQRLVYAASSSSYGIPARYPTPEDAPMAPEYPYALTKSMGETLVLHWGKVYRMPVISLRLFNVYGPRSRTTGAYGAVFGVFLAQKLNGKPFTVVGDGEQRRDFTFVTDVVAAFIQAARSSIPWGVYNVGSGTTQSVNRLVELLGGGERITLPRRPGEPDITFADTTRIQQDLNWRPQVSFEQGVARMLATLDDWRDAPVWEPDSIARATASWFQYLGSGQP